MILYPPLHFDANEWFFITSTAVTWSLLFLLPKRFSLLVVLTIWVFNYSLAQTADFTIGVKPYDLYDVNDRPQLEIFDFLIYFFTYPPASYLVIYAYDYLKLTKVRLAALVVFCAYVTQMLEWAAAKWFHVYKYMGWSPWYSGPVYILVFLANILVFRFVQRALAGKKIAE